MFHPTGDSWGQVSVAITSVAFPGSTPGAGADLEATSAAPARAVAREREPPRPDAEPSGRDLYVVSSGECIMSVVAERVPRAAVNLRMNRFEN